MPVTFQNADIKFSLKQKSKLKTFISKQLKQAGIENFNLDYILCSDEYLLDINRRFLDHDYYTDIITFPLSEDKNLLEAEIYISVDRVRENGKDFSLSKRTMISQSFENELNRVIFHGVLHLIGFKDKTKVQKAAMRKAEDIWLKNFSSFQN